MQSFQFPRDPQDFVNKALLESVTSWAPLEKLSTLRQFHYQLHSPF